MNELRWWAYNSDPPLRSGWGNLPAGQVACKLLVVWKVYWWPHWSALPCPEFPVLDLDDDQSFDQYSLPSNPDLKGHHWDKDVWEPAWTEAYSAYFPFHIRVVAGDDASVPCLYSLARCSLFFWFQRSGEGYFYDPRTVYDPEVDLPVDCTRIHAASRATRDWPGQPSGHLCSPTRPSGSRLVPRYLLGLLRVTGVQHGNAFSPGCSVVFPSAGESLPWADWFGYPLLHLLALVVFLLVLVYAAARFWRWISLAQLCSASVGCVHFALAAVTDPSWDGSLITRMIVWLVDSGASRQMIPDRDLLHNFVPFATKPQIGTAKAGQYSYAIGYGDMHQLLQTSVGERKTVLRGV